MIRIRGYQTLLLVLMGSIDCLTTVIGVLYFGAVELNPLIAGVVSMNLPAFIILKLTATVFVYLIFNRAEKILITAENKTARAFNYTHKLLNLTKMGIIAFLIVVVANNIIVLVNSH